MRHGGCEFIFIYVQWNHVWFWLIGWLCPLSCSVQNRRQVNGESILSISKVRREFLNVPFRCHVVSPADRKTGLLYLQEGAVSVYKSLGFINLLWSSMRKKNAPANCSRLVSVLAEQHYVDLNCGCLNSCSWPQRSLHHSCTVPLCISDHPDPGSRIPLL